MTLIPQLKFLSMDLLLQPIMKKPMLLITIFLSPNNVDTFGAKLPENGNYGGDVYLNKTEAGEEEILSKILI
jgi:hypothetical protein